MQEEVAQIGEGNYMRVQEEQEPVYIYKKYIYQNMLENKTKDSNHQTYELSEYIQAACQAQPCWSCLLGQ